MPRSRYSAELRVREVPHRDPQTPEQVEASQKPPLVDQTVVEGRSKDALLQAARSLLQERGHEVRALNLGPAGTGGGLVVHAAVYRLEESQRDRKRRSRNRHQPR